jgi:hypothetical protein
VHNPIDASEPTQAAPRAPHLRSDCTNCSGLCCVVHAFDADQGFGFSKPAHVPCQNLAGDFRCAIHERLRPLGFRSCTSYECYGAGPRVTRLFTEGSWRASSDTAARIFDAFLKYRSLHELMALLLTAVELGVAVNPDRLSTYAQLIDTWCESGKALTPAIRTESVRREALCRLRSECRGTYSLDGTQRG